MKRIVTGTVRCKTAWTDPDHVRLTHPEPEERVNPHRAERLREADPADPWAAAAIEAPAGGES